MKVLIIYDSVFGISGLFMIIPSTAGMIGLLFSLLSLIPTMIWLILIALKLFQLANQKEKLTVVK